MPLILRDVGRIERISRSRDHDRIITLADDAADDQMHALSNSISKDDSADSWLRYAIYSGDVLAHAFPDEGETCRLAVTARTGYSIQNEPSSLPGIRIDGFIGDQVWIQHTRENLFRIGI